MEGENALFELGLRSFSRDLPQLSIVKFIDVVLSLSEQATVKDLAFELGFTVRDIYAKDCSRFFHYVECFCWRFHVSEFNSYDGLLGVEFRDMKPPAEAF